MLLGIPAQLEQAFAAQGVPVARYPSVPALCTAKACSSLEVWGDGRRAVLAPRQGKPDFAVVIYSTHADALKSAQLFRANPIVGAVVRRSSLLMYLRSSPRLAKLRAAFR